MSIVKLERADVPCKLSNPQMIAQCMVGNTTPNNVKCVGNSSKRNKQYEQTNS